MNKILLIIMLLILVGTALAIDPEPPGGGLCAPWCNITGSSNGTTFTVTLTFGGVNPPHMSWCTLDVYSCDASGEVLDGYGGEWGHPSGYGASFNWEDLDPNTAYVVAVAQYACEHCNVIAEDSCRIYP